MIDYLKHGVISELKAREQHIVRTLHVHVSLGYIADLGIRQSMKLINFFFVVGRLLTTLGRLVVSNYRIVLLKRVFITMNQDSKLMLKVLLVKRKAKVIVRIVADG